VRTTPPRRWSTGVPLVALACLVAARALPAQARPDTVALTFDWPVGSTADVDHHRWRVRWFRSRGPKDTIFATCVFAIAMVVN